MLYLFDDYALDTERRELRRGQALAAIEPKVFDLLAFVIENHQRVVSRDDLIAQVWDGRIVSESALARCISEARSAIGDNGEAQRLIKTLPRKGLRFVGLVREERQLSGVAEVGTRPETRAAPLSLPDRPSIAVLPFENISGDKGQDYFATALPKISSPSCRGSRSSSSSPAIPPSSTRPRRPTCARSGASSVCATSCRAAFGAVATGFASRCNSPTP